VFPAGVRFADDALFDPWYTTPSYKAYTSPGLYDELMYDYLLAMWLLTGNDRFLEPMHATMQLVLDARRASANGAQVKRGSAAWVVQQLTQRGRWLSTVQKWRLISGDQRYDTFLLKSAPPCVRYLLGSEDEKAVLESLQVALKTNTQQYELLTSEVLFTDRVYLAGCAELYAMYGGGVGDTSGCPGIAVRWQNAGEDLAVWVREATQRHFVARVFSFAEHAKHYAMQHWRLTPGQYRLSLRPDGPAGPALETRDVELQHRGDSIPLALPPHQSLVVELTQLRRFNRRPTQLPDLAAAPAPAVRPKGGPLSWDIYNLGPAAAKEVKVQLLLAGEVVETRIIDLVPPLSDYQSGVSRVTFDHPGTGPLAIVIDPEDHIDEITERNNRAGVASGTE